MKKSSKNSALSNGVAKSDSKADVPRADAANINDDANVVSVRAAGENAPAMTVSSDDAATQIESHLVARVLVLTSPHVNDESTSAPTHARWSAILAQAGHQVSWTERDAWKPDALDPCGEDAPEIMLFETAVESEWEAIAAVCAQIKTSGAGHCTALLVALRAQASAEGKLTGNAMQAALEKETMIVARLQEAGTDDFLIGSSETELLARIGVMARLARVRAELNATREHLRMQIQLDDLTRLLNRRFFFQAAHREYSRARRYNHDLSCLMLDVNNFKQINAAFGYECGDNVLRQVANVLRDSTRDCDILARWDEDKFVMLLPETPLEGAITLRENIAREVMAQAFKWRGHDLPLSVSVGEAARRLTRSAQLPAGETALEFGAAFIDSDQPEVASVSLREEMAGLLEEADAALYVAKRGVRYQALPGAPASQISPATN